MNEWTNEAMKKQANKKIVDLMGWRGKELITQNDKQKKNAGISEWIHAVTDNEELNEQINGYKEKHTVNSPRMNKQINGMTKRKKESTNWRTDE